MEKQRTKAEIRDLVLNKKTHVLRNDLKPGEAIKVLNEFKNGDYWEGLWDYYGCVSDSFEIVFESELNDREQIPMSEYSNATDGEEPTNPPIDMEFIDKAALAVLNGIYSNFELIKGYKEVANEEGISTYKCISEDSYKQAHAMYKARQEFINKLNQEQ